MLRVGLTGGLGSGKSTAAAMFAAHGAYVISADQIGREMMQPGQAVYAAIVAHFGGSVVAGDGTLDRAALARIAFAGDAGGGRVEELNAIVHPAVIARQAKLTEQIAVRDPDAAVIVESALIFETKYGGTRGEVADGSTTGWWKRFDRIILVTASEDVKIARFIARASGSKTLSVEARGALEAEARRRLGQQIDDNRKAANCDYVLANNGAIEQLQLQVDSLWPVLLSQQVGNAGEGST